MEGAHVSGCHQFLVLSLSVSISVRLSLLFLMLLLRRAPNVEGRAQWKGEACAGLAVVGWVLAAV